MLAKHYVLAKNQKGALRLKKGMTKNPKSLIVPKTNVTSGTGQTKFR